MFYVLILMLKTRTNLSQFLFECRVILGLILFISYSNSLIRIRIPLEFCTRSARILLCVFYTNPVWILKSWNYLNSILSSVRIRIIYVRILFKSSYISFRFFSSHVFVFCWSPESSTNPVGILFESRWNAMLILLDSVLIFFETHSKLWVAIVHNKSWICLFILISFQIKWMKCTYFM